MFHSPGVLVIPLQIVQGLTGILSEQKSFVLCVGNKTGKWLVFKLPETKVVSNVFSILLLYPTDAEKRSYYKCGSLHSWN